VLLQLHCDEINPVTLPAAMKKKSSPGRFPQMRDQRGSGKIVAAGQGRGGPAPRAQKRAAARDMMRYMSEFLRSH